MVVSSANSFDLCLSLTRRRSDPVRQRGAIQIDALPGANLGLPVQRQMIGIGYQHLSDRSLGRQATLNQPGRGLCLHDAVLASPASVFGPPVEENAELRRHQVRPLALVLADPVQFTLATGAGLVSDDSIRGRCAGSDPRLILRL